MLGVFTEGDFMSSKKASFESRDLSHVSDAAPDAGKVARDTPPQKATFDAIDIADDSGLTIDMPDEGDGEIAENPSFYSRDPEVATSDISKKEKKKYMGVERRRDNRRKAQDRRSDVRFDLDKSDRRENDGRREDDATVKYW
jgi:hypothetical protein